MNYTNSRPQGNDYKKSGGTFRGGYNGSERRSGAGDAFYKKRSGCAMRDSYTHQSGPNKGQASGTPVVWGWKVAQGGGLIKFVAVMNKDPKTKSPRWLKFVVSVTPPNGVKFLTTGFWDIDKHRLHMPDMDLIANPGTKDGGYFGRNYTPKNK